VLTALRNLAIYSLVCRWQCRRNPLTTIPELLLGFLLDVGNHLRTQYLSGKKVPHFLSWRLEYVFRSSVGIADIRVPDCIAKMNKVVPSAFGNNVLQ